MVSVPLLACFASLPPAIFCDGEEEEEEREGGIEPVFDVGGGTAQRRNRAI